MNPVDRFEALAARARLESPPTLDVTQRVLRRLQHVEHAYPLDWVLPLLTGLSAAAAAIVTALALDAWNVLTDPLAGFLHPLAW